MNAGKSERQLQGNDEKTSTNIEKNDRAIFFSRFFTPKTRYPLICFLNKKIGSGVLDVKNKNRCSFSILKGVF